MIYTLFKFKLKEFIDVCGVSGKFCFFLDFPNSTEDAKMKQTLLIGTGRDST